MNQKALVECRPPPGHVSETLGIFFLCLEYDPDFSQNVIAFLSKPRPPNFRQICSLLLELSHAPTNKEEDRLTNKCEKT